MNRFREIFWFTPLKRILTSALALVLLAAAGIGAYVVYTPDLHCAKGVDRPEKGAECIGVSGDGYDFGVPGLHAVAQAVARENKTLKSGTYATVALLLPLTSTDSGTATKVLNEVQGAFLEQYRANHNDNGQVPKIRLVLANSGRGSEQWSHAVDRLKSMTDAPDNLRAVSGIAISSPSTKAAVKELTASHIPVIGTTITADDIANSPSGDPYPGLARVSPTNLDEARALAQFGKVDAKRALLVQDTVTTDYYTSTLKAAFTTLLKGAPYAPNLFTSPPDSTEDGTTANTFDQMKFLICDTRADTIFFAGRHTQLRQFINALGARGCQERAFTILTGDEASYLGRDTKLDKSALAKKITVRYASLAHPDAWTTGTPPKTGGSAADYKTFAALLAKAAGDDVGPIGPSQLADGQAIVAYDAMTLAVHGIRKATVKGKTLPELADVGTQWTLVKGQLRVFGASGWICLDNHGNPYNKAVPIVELTPQGTQRFVKIAWPEGKPPTQACLPPAVS
ncbi:ABC transporter substrate-binding protein [Streptomyces sp. NBC_01465]|uniref:ABC transporter substrate-binding protein n=1 Tax=Streptomyces sp. NBC_01465 TaxID=2903878 RepID=UPI002E2F8A61|nr:ABC transporter substrate-binding protein [Streptomyces sp. NBC_01465]